MQNKPKPFLSQLLPNDDKIAHGFFGRKGGVSEGIYEGLNCGLGSDDKKENVLKNRELLANAMGVSGADIANPYQIHSATCLYADKPFEGRAPDGDAVVTDKKGVLIGILTADCTPILFADKVNGVIGAAHAGWKGAFGGIIEATIKMMIEKGAKRENIEAAIGPCIEQKSYEVSQEYYENFLKDNVLNQVYFKKGKSEGKYQFDLKGYCKSRLINAGIENIDVLPNDTCSEEEEFFSNRRRNLRCEKDYGRNFSVIIMK